ncbi:MAG TPA: xyloglucanase [Silvibacterium sp.]|nr:xyloglucanase [Silvibacterium sp.]
MQFHQKFRAKYRTFVRYGIMALSLGMIMGALELNALSQEQGNWHEPYQWSNVVIGGGGGFIPGIVFSQTANGLVYIRTDIGGAYRWDAHTGKWIPLLDWIGFKDWNLIGVESIAIDPVDPDTVYLEVGTYTNDYTTQNGAILKSRDRGRHFERYDLPFKVGGNMPGRGMGERLAIDPNDHSILYLGTRSGNGLWKSIDAGRTWSKVTSFPDAGTYFPGTDSSYDEDLIGVVWVTFDPTSGAPVKSSKTIYVGVADEQNPSIYHTTDGGGTWTAVAGQPVGFLPHHGVLASNGILYVTYSNGAGPYDGTLGDVWKYDTKQNLWTLISPVPSSSSSDYFGYGGLGVDAKNPNTVVVAALNSWWPDTIFWRTTDGGSTWTPIWTWGAYPDRNLRYTQDISLAPWLTFGAAPAPPVPSPKLGWMVDGLQIDPFNSNSMLYGTGATLYGTNNLTAWDTSSGTIQIAVTANGVEETAVQDLISPPSGAHLLSALGDIGGFRHNDLTKPTMMYTNPVFGTTTSLDFAQLSPNYVVRVGDPGDGSSVAYSTDGGTTWTPGTASPGQGGMVAVSANASRIVWSPGGAAVVYSTNNGSTWTASTGVPAGASIRSDRVNPLKFYAFSNGVFYISVDGGVTFTATAATGLPPAGTSAYFKAVPGIEGDIWLAGGSEASGVYGLWHSSNGGGAFTKLPNVEEADDIGFGAPKPASDDSTKPYVALYTAAQVHGVRGFFRSDDGGHSWLRINDDRHQYGAATAAITGDPRVYGRVYISTNGRGIIMGNLRQDERENENGGSH